MPGSDYRKRDFLVNPHLCDNSQPPDGSFSDFFHVRCTLWSVYLVFFVTVIKNTECVWISGTVCAVGESHHLNPPSEVPMVTGVELGVGLSVATLVFFLHSNATWSLHSLWQFIPQSERARRMHNMSEQEQALV